MENRDFFSFIGAAFFTGILYAGIAFFGFVSTFSLAGQTLDEKEADDITRFFIVLAITILTALIMYRKYKAGKSYAAAGIVFPFLFVVYELLSSLVTVVGNQRGQQAFDRHSWICSESKPFNMGKTLVKERRLLGLSKTELYYMLGESERGVNFSFDQTYYQMESSWQLRLFFEKEKVSKAQIYQPGFDD